MKSLWWKRGMWGVAGIGLVFVLVRAFDPTPVPVDVGMVRRGTLRVTVDDDGRTRVRERYTIAAPIEGRLLRTALDPGDEVRARDTVVAEFAPVAPSFLDERSRAEAAARLSRAEAAVGEAAARAQQAEADLELAVVELERARELAQRDMSARADLDVAERNERRAHEGLRAARFGVEVAGFELALARASLDEPHAEGAEDPAVGQSENASNGDRVVERRLRLRSPIDGRVLRVFEESARALPAGSPLLEVGNTARLEIVADYLTQDAVKVEPGMGVLVEGWGGEQPSGGEQVLEGSVRVVEPGGFTKVSALGVEEQRVNIIVDPVGDAAAWSAFGDGYRVELRIVLWEHDDVLTVPTGALFRRGDAWSAFVVEDGVAHERTVELGRRSALEAEVVSGLEAGARVVLYPSALIAEGMPVEARG